jgi:hypothetical protein
MNNAMNNDLPRSPALLAVLAGVLVLVAAFAPALWHMLRPLPPAAADAMPPPWQVELDDQGRVRALGLRLPGATLADAAARWEDDLRMALVETRHQPLALEAYVESWSGGGVNGKLVLATDADAAALARWRDAAGRRETVNADSQRWALAEDDRAQALRSAIAGLSFVPASRPDEAVLLARFGPPTERLDDAQGNQHWLYPERGLALTRQPASGQLVMQLTAPADFERRLRAPLLAAPAAD